MTTTTECRRACAPPVMHVSNSLPPLHVDVPQVSPASGFGDDIGTRHPPDKGGMLLRRVELDLRLSAGDVGGRWHSCGEAQSYATIRASPMRPKTLSVTKRAGGGSGGGGGGGVSADASPSSSRLSFLVAEEPDPCRPRKDGLNRT